VSVPTGGGDADGQSHRPDVSDLGGVAFSSEADDLVGSDTNGMEDAFVHTPAGKTKRVSVASNGDEADNGGSRPSISRTGNKIAFQSESTNLSSLAGGQSDVYVHTMADGKTRLASRASNGTHPPGSAEIFHGALSFSGRFIAFTSDQALVTADANSTWDMYWHDMKTGKTRLASYSQDGSSAAGSDEGTISGDGRWVGFDSTATNLVPDDGNGTSDGFLRGPMI
jgi:hypothetical protein